MISVYIIILLVVLGLCFGSFACATAWRLRARQLRDDKKQGEKVDEKEYISLNKLFTGSFWSGRSKCMHCGYTLAWYDLVPVFSWLFLRGKCRKCHKNIGLTEPLSEIGLAIFFVTSYIFWPNDLNSLVGISQLVIWLISGVILMILFIYDLKWFLIPTKLNYAIIGLGIINSVLTIVMSSNKSTAIIGILVAMMLLSGIYMVIYLASRKRWIGMGDIILGLGLSLLLSSWPEAYVALFMANFIGCIVVIPGMLKGKLKKDSHIPFGPLLIAGFWIGGLFGSQIMSAILHGLI